MRIVDEDYAIILGTLTEVVRIDRVICHELDTVFETFILTLIEGNYI